MLLGGAAAITASGRIWRNIFTKCGRWPMRWPPLGHGAGEDIARGTRISGEREQAAEPGSRRSSDQDLHAVEDFGRQDAPQRGCDAKHARRLQ